MKRECGPHLRIVGKDDDGGVERHAATVVRHAARDGCHLLVNSISMSVDVRGEVQWRVGDVDAFSPDALHLPIAHRAGADEATAPEPRSSKVQSSRVTGGPPLMSAI